VVKFCWFQLFSSSTASKCLDPLNETEYAGTDLGIALCWLETASDWGHRFVSS
jgi:hypothetical protein